jgi:HTH-type transcriptional regulator/antitoxin HigA
MFVLKTIERDWNPISKYLRVPHTEPEYERLVALLNELIDEVGEDEMHPLGPRSWK